MQVFGINDQNTKTIKEKDSIEHFLNKYTKFSYRFRNMICHEQITLK